ncbi:site-specific integrase [Pseudooceanicola spongiae]|uniref:Tyrosine-type recombinase/integrase n=1 Tax=Pseudooceanicola spongiae TaxID=2613965 RepID=A0A7L9WJG2_9RHOB|nr:site-specific integrase [Pseudooceanicola spongiae]QOL79688.1 tyrosine-type recombinase/integrase [Pseudooceanicola spongiae]
MATIRKRVRKDGSVAYMVQIIFTQKGRPTYREARTFDRQSAATVWAKKRTDELNKAGENLFALKTRQKTLADAIRTYTDQSEKQIGRTKAQVLSTILEFDISDMLCAEIRSSDIVAFARELGIKRSAATVSNYLSHLSSVFAIAKPAWNMPLEHQQMKDAFAVCNRLGITGKSRARARRPTLVELNSLMEHFAKKHAARPSSAPMHMITAFALFSTRRQEEITRIKWADLDADAKRIMVKDMKHPGDKAGNDVLCDLPDAACSIALSMPRNSAFIFPFSTDAISAAFTRACKVLAIDDLRFHDLRHEGVSRLFEMGLHIPQAAAVSGHRSWQSLQRYTHLHERGDKYDEWPWLLALAKGESASD